MNRSKVTRTTSVECYKELVRKKVLPVMRREIYKWLFEHGPATRNEVARSIHMIPNNTSTRLKEMVDLGIVREVGEDKCGVTGVNVTLYDVTNIMPHDGQLPGRSKVKREAEYYYVGSCEECLPLADEDDESGDVCWMDPQVKTIKKGQPKNCPLLMKDFVVRAEARR